MVNKRVVNAPWLMRRRTVCLRSFISVALLSKKRCWQTGSLAIASNSLGCCCCCCCCCWLFLAMLTTIIAMSASCALSAAAIVPLDGEAWLAVSRTPTRGCPTVRAPLARVKPRSTSSSMASCVLLLSPDGTCSTPSSAFTSASAVV